MTLKEIKTKYTVFTYDGLYLLYSKFDYVGYLTKEKTKWYYHGLPMNEVRHVKSIDEITNEVTKFICQCEIEWVRPEAIAPNINKSVLSEFALSYVANKMGWKTEDMSSTYVVKTPLGITAFRVSANNEYKNNIGNFIVTYNSGWYTESPTFDNYFDALKWLKNLVSQIYISTGVEFLTTAIHNNLMSDDVEEIIMSKLNFTGMGIDVKKVSLTDYLISTLENQIKILKEAKK